MVSEVDKVGLGCPEAGVCGAIAVVRSWSWWEWTMGTEKLLEN